MLRSSSAASRRSPAPPSRLELQAPRQPERPVLQRGARCVPALKGTEKRRAVKRFRVAGRALTWPPWRRWRHLPYPPHPAGKAGAREAQTLTFRCPERMLRSRCCGPPLLLIPYWQHPEPSTDVACLLDTANPWSRGEAKVKGKIQCLQKSATWQLFRPVSLLNSVNTLIKEEIIRTPREVPALCVCAHYPAAASLNTLNFQADTIEVCLNVTFVLITR